MQPAFQVEWFPMHMRIALEQFLALSEDDQEKDRMLTHFDTGIEHHAFEDFEAAQDCPWQPKDRNSHKLVPGSRYIVRIGRCATFAACALRASGPSGVNEAWLRALCDQGGAFTQPIRAVLEESAESNAALCLFTQLCFALRGRIPTKNYHGLIADACNMLCGKLISPRRQLTAAGELQRAPGFTAGGGGTKQVIARRMIYNLMHDAQKHRRPARSKNAKRTDRRQTTQLQLFNEALPALRALLPVHPAPLEETKVANDREAHEAFQATADDLGRHMPATPPRAEEMSSLGVPTPPDTPRSAIAGTAQHAIIDQRGRFDHQILDLELLRLAEQELLELFEAEHRISQCSGRFVTITYWICLLLKICNQLIRTIAYRAALFLFRAVVKLDMGHCRHLPQVHALPKCELEAPAAPQRTTALLRSVFVRAVNGHCDAAGFN